MIAQIHPAEAQVCANWVFLRKDTLLETLIIFDLSRIFRPVRVIFSTYPPPVISTKGVARTEKSQPQFLIYYVLRFLHYTHFVRYGRNDKVNKIMPAR